MSNRPMPAHHRIVDVAKSRVSRGYGVALALTIEGHSTLWQIVAHAPTGIPEGEPEPDAGYVRLVVAPARVPT